MSSSQASQRNVVTLGWATSQTWNAGEKQNTRDSLAGTAGGQLAEES